MTTNEITVEQLRRISQAIVGGCSLKFSVDCAMGDGAFDSMSEEERGQFTVKTFKNKNFTKRDYEATNVAFCQGIVAPDENYVEVAESELTKTSATSLWIEAGCRFFGWM